jgi:hypothetical protein
LVLSTITWYGCAATKEDADAGVGANDAALAGDTANIPESGSDASACDPGFGCIEEDGACHPAVDDTHCSSSGPARKCVDCTASGLYCLYDPGVDGPQCVCHDYPHCGGSSSGSSSGGLTDSGSDGSDGTLLEAATGDSAGGG